MIISTNIQFVFGKMFIFDGIIFVKREIVIKIDYVIEFC